MLLSGMDVSGDSIVGNYKFLAIVVGTKESINGLFQLIGKKKIHMKEIQDKKNNVKKLLMLCHLIEKKELRFVSQWIENAL